MKGKITDTWTFKLNTVFQIGFSSLVEESFNLAQLVVTSPPYRKCSLCHANHKRHQFKTTMDGVQPADKHNQQIFSSVKWDTRT